MNRYLRACLFALVSVVVLFARRMLRHRLPLQPASPIKLGRTVRLNKLPQRIVSLAPSNTEIIYALGLADRVVGVTDFDNYPPEVKNKQSIGGFSDPNLEKVVSLSPDLVVAAPIHEKQVVPQLEAKGIDRHGTGAPRHLTRYSQPSPWSGRPPARTARPADLVSQMQRRIKAVTDKTDRSDA